MKCLPHREQGYTCIFQGLRSQFQVNSQSPSLGNEEVKGLVWDFTSSVNMLPSKHSRMAFPEHKATLTVIAFFPPLSNCLHPWVPIASPSLMVQPPWPPTQPGLFPDCRRVSLPENAAWSFPLLPLPPPLASVDQPGSPLPDLPKES